MEMVDVERTSGRRRPLDTQPLACIRGRRGGVNNLAGDRAG
jgi:hypothetical protein